MQISVAIKKILYAADAKESALDEAQAYINETLDAVEDEPETETWSFIPDWFYKRFSGTLLNELSANCDVRLGILPIQWPESVI